MKMCFCQVHLKTSVPVRAFAPQERTNNAYHLYLFRRSGLNCGVLTSGLRRLQERTNLPSLHRSSAPALRCYLSPATDCVRGFCLSTPERQTPLVKSCTIKPMGFLQSFVVALVFAVTSLATTLGFFHVAHNPTVQASPATTTAQTTTASSNQAPMSAPSSTATSSGTSSSAASATIDQTELSTTTPNPTISGTAYGLTSVYILVAWMEGKGGLKSFTTDPVPVIDGRWSTPISPDAFAGTLQFGTQVFDSNGALPNAVYEIAVYQSPVPECVAAGTNPLVSRLFYGQF